MQGEGGRGRTELADRDQTLRVPVIDHVKVCGFQLIGHLAAAKGIRKIRSLFQRSSEKAGEKMHFGGADWSLLESSKARVGEGWI